MSNIRSRSSSRNGGGRSRNNNTGGHRSSNNGKRNHGGGNNGSMNTGNAKSAYEKYTEKAKEALSYGDRTAAENFFQHADHYNRILIEAESRKSEMEQKNNSNSENAVSDDDNGKAANKTAPVSDKDTRQNKPTENTEESTDNSASGSNKSGKIPKELAL